MTKIIIQEGEFEEAYVGFIDRLQSERKEQGVSVYGLAKKSGLSASTITNIENKTKRASLMSIIRMSRVLGVML